MYKEISVKDVKENLVKLIASDWALLTAGTVSYTHLVLPKFCECTDF